MPSFAIYGNERRRGPIYVPGAVAGYHANAVFFASDTFLGSDPLTGFNDGQEGFFSAWLKFETNGNEEFFISAGGGTNFFSIQREFSTGKLIFTGATSAPTSILQLVTATAFTSAAWQHVMATWNLATTSGSVYVNNNLDATAALATNAVIDYNNGGFQHFFNNNGAGNANFNGSIADLWFDTNTHDLSDSAVRAKFINQSTLKPVDLGVAGATPFGTSPIWYHSGATIGWEVNKGTGLEPNSTSGTPLATAASSPSD